ncbi:MAG: hypothetical protein E6767_13580 [Dysgonomonas sp.]|nr:hypothetical protein [Dysgonomonas sp.]
MKSFLVVCCLFICISCYSQKADTVYTVVEQMPSFPGGESEMYRFIRENIRSVQIPDSLIMENSRTVIRFVVSKTGEIKNIQPAKEYYKGTILTDSYINIIKQMPRWIPGKQDGKEVDVYYLLPAHIRWGR